MDIDNDDSEYTQVDYAPMHVAFRTRKGEEVRWILVGSDKWLLDHAIRAAAEITSNFLVVGKKGCNTFYWDEFDGLRPGVG